MRARRLLSSTALALILMAAAPGTAAAEDPPGEPHLSITAYGPSLVRAGDAVAVVASVANPGEQMAVSMHVTEQPLTTRQQLSTWEDGDLAAPMRRVAQGIAGGPAGSTTAFTTLTASSSQLGLPRGSWGVYGVSFTLDRDGFPVQEIRSFLTWVDAPTPTLSVTAVALVSGGPVRADALLAASDRPEVTLAVDPLVFADSALAVPSPRSRDVYTLPGGNLDVASAARAGYGALVARARERALADGPPEISPQPWVAVLPGLDQAALDLAHAQGATVALVSPVDSAAAPATTTIGRLASNGPVIVSADTRLSEIVARADQSPGLGVARVHAESAVMAARPSTRRAVVVLGPRWVLDPGIQASGLDALLDAPWTRAVTLTRATTEAGELALEPPSELPDESDIPAGLVANAASTLERLDRLAAASSDPLAIADGPSLDLLGTLAFDGRWDTEMRDDSIRSAVDAITQLRANVGTASGSDFNLLSSSGRVPLTVRNSLPADVTVTVRLESSSPYLVVLDSPTVTIPAGTEQQVHVPVEAVSNADVRARVVLEDREGNPLSPPTEVRVRVRADWGNAFSLGMFLVFSALLASGVVRTLRRGRRDTRTTAVPEEGA